MSLPPLIVGTRHCRVLTVSNINSDATGVDITGLSTFSQRFKRVISCRLHIVRIFSVMLSTGVKGGAYKSSGKSLMPRALPVGGRVNQSLPYLSTGLF